MNLKQFAAAFKVEPVRFDFSEFAKDGAFSAETIKALKDDGLDAIWLKPMTSQQRADFEVSIVGDGKKRNMQNLYARYVALSWVDEKGKPMGTPEEVGQLRADFIAELFAKVQDLNGVSKEAQEEAGKDS